MKISAFLDGFREGITPDEIISVSEWAEKYRILTSKSSSEAGPWNNNRTPYLIEPMNCFSPHDPTEEIDMMFGAQLGKTETILNAVGCLSHISPGPMMLVQPTLDMAKKFSKQRIEPLFDTPVLSERMELAKESSNNALIKEFMGGMLIIAGANSAAALASTPVKYLLLDETDRYPLDVDGEGSPVDLAVARTRTFTLRKIGKVSTPTIKGQSEIEASYNQGTKEKYHVPCPYCGHKQELEFKQLQWEKGRPETVLYYCIGCGEGIPEYKKTYMLSLESGAEWIATAKGLPRKRSFHLNSLYSPVGWLSWVKIAQTWEKAQGHDNRLKTFINTILAESWQAQGEAPDWQRLYDQRENFPVGIVPSTAAILTMGVDVQADRLEAHVIGWGRNSEKWTVDYQVIPGDTTNLNSNGPWQRMADLIQKEYTHSTGQKLRIHSTCIDSGYNTQVVYEFVRKFSHLRVYAIKGQENLPMVVGSPKDVDIKLPDGKIIYRGTKYWPVGVNVLKSDIYGWLKRECPTEEERIENGYPTGFFHFPEMNEDFFKQLTAEQLVPVVIKGYKRSRWQKVYERNEVLDTSVYATAAAYLAGIPTWDDLKWTKQESLVGVEVKPKEVSNEIHIEKEVPKKRRRRVSDLSDDFDLDLDFDL